MSRQHHSQLVLHLGGTHRGSRVFFYVAELEPPGLQRALQQLLRLALKRPTWKVKKRQWKGSDRSGQGSEKGSEIGDQGAFLRSARCAGSG